jgi:hypothetical protein
MNVHFIPYTEDKIRTVGNPTVFQIHHQIRYSLPNTQMSHELGVLGEHDYLADYGKIRVLRGKECCTSCGSSLVLDLFYPEQSATVLHSSQ